MKHTQQASWTRLCLWQGSLLLALATAMLWLSRYPLRWDLSKEGRFTLSAAMRAELRQLESPLYVEVYLNGVLPAGFRRLRKNLQDMLQQMTKESSVDVQLRYIDPTAGRNSRQRQQYMLSLAQKGIQPTNLSYTEEGRSIERLIFPGLMLGYQGNEVGLMLLKGSRSAGPEGILNQSIENLEYELLKGLQKLRHPVPRPIGLLRGHDTPTLQWAQLQQTLIDEGYAPQDVHIEETGTFEELPVLLILKPVQSFNKAALYRIDQYLMRGGQLLLFVDGLHVAMDSVGEAGTVALPRPTGIEDLLFHYGLRLAPQLLTDLYSARYPIVAGQMGDQAQVRLLPWPFFPVIHNKSAHPITRNLEALLLRYGSKLDTVRAENIRKTPLLWSSAKTRLLGAPAAVALNQLRDGVDPSLYQDGEQIVACLLEGSFSSAFRHRPLPVGSGRFLSQGQPSKVLVVADGDLLTADLHPRTGELMEIGMYLSEGTQYGNRDFLLQALDYLYDKDGAILARNRRVQLRPLDKQKIQEERQYWQLLNLLLPLLAIAALGVGRQMWRNWRYAKL